jgi:soluble lytic murein transglycosylase-like protein
MRFCLTFACLAAAAMVVAPAASLPDSGRTVKSVVRADANGRLVRSVVITARVIHENVVTARPVAAADEEPGATASPAGPIRNFHDAVDRIAEKHSLPPRLVHSVIRVESNYNPNAISAKGALGLMQLIPSTARRFGVSNAFDPVENVEGGAKYLRYLLDLYKGDYRLALAAYNAGEGAVAKHGGVPPYAETVNYLQQVRRRLVEASQKEQAEKVQVKSEPAKPADHNPIREVVEPDGRVHYVSK